MMYALNELFETYITTSGVLWFVALLFAAAWVWFILAGSVEVTAERTRADRIERLHQRAARRRRSA